MKNYQCFELKLNKLHITFACLWRGPQLCSHAVHLQFPALSTSQFVVSQCPKKNVHVCTLGEESPQCMHRAKGNLPFFHFIYNICVDEKFNYKSVPKLRPDWKVTGKCHRSTVSSMNIWLWWIFVTHRQLGYTQVTENFEILLRSQTL